MVLNCTTMTNFHNIPETIRVSLVNLKGNLHEIARRCLTIAALLILLVLLQTVYAQAAGQTVHINVDRWGDVRGNSTDGSGNNHDASPNNNTLNISSGATLRRKVF